MCPVRLEADTLDIKSSTISLGHRVPHVLLFKLWCLLNLHTSDDKKRVEFCVLLKTCTNSLDQRSKIMVYMTLSCDQSRPSIYILYICSLIQQNWPL